MPISGARRLLPALTVLALLAAGLVLPTTADEPRKEPAGGTLALSLRSRVELFKGSGQWDEVAVHKDLPARETAVILCDVWDNHWCKKAAGRCDALARRMVPVLAALRARGVQVIHAPSECMDFYKDTPQRKRIQQTAHVDPPKALDLPDPKLPIDDSNGGCDDAIPAASHRAWTRQHAAIPIADEDVISDRGDEVYSFLKQNGRGNLLVMGVHTNMCVLNRTFAIKQMTKWGIHCVLVRDLTDAMYNPKNAPFVSHDEGTGLVIQHIEKYWCPSVLSTDLLAAAKAGR